MCILSIHALIKNHYQISGGTHHRDFLQRCNDYEICDVTLPKADDADEEGAEEAAAAGVVGGGRRPPDLAKMNREREEKIRRYREQRELEERVAELRAAVLGAPVRADEGREIGFLRRLLAVKYGVN